MTAMRRAALAVGALLMAGCVPSGPATLASDAQEAVPTAIEAYDDSDLRADLAKTTERSTATDEALRKQIKRLRARIATLEDAAAEAERVEHLEGATRQLAEDVRLLAEDIERVDAARVTNSTRSIGGTVSCAIDDGEWSPVLEVCLK